MILCSLCVSVKVSLVLNEFFASNGSNEKGTKYNRFHLCIYTHRSQTLQDTNRNTELAKLLLLMCVCVLWFGFRYAHFGGGTFFFLNSVVFLFRSYVGCISPFCFAVAFDNLATNWLYSTNIVYCFFCCCGFEWFFPFYFFGWNSVSVVATMLLLFCHSCHRCCRHRNRRWRRETLFKKKFSVSEATWLVIFGCSTCYVLCLRSACIFTILICGNCFCLKFNGKRKKKTIYE